mgnify:CR=1 FL=1
MNKDRFLISNLTNDQIQLIFSMMDHHNEDKEVNALARKLNSNIIKYDHSDYKEIAKKVQKEWDDNFIDEIKIVIGDEWLAGNLSYHLQSRPVWNDPNTLGTGTILIGNKLKPCKSEKFQVFDGSGKVHCFNMDPQVVMIGRTK